jgi:hypothetical protein
MLSQSGRLIRVGLLVACIQSTVSVAQESCRDGPYEKQTGGQNQRHACDMYAYIGAVVMVGSVLFVLHQ